MAGTGRDDNTSRQDFHGQDKMPLQNRVTPDGKLVSHPQRGLFMGNRGILHDEHRQLGRARWRHPHWIICKTEFKNRHRVVMTPRRYTELFFVDEAVALAAGHRPCAECRRTEYNAYLTAIADITGQRRLQANELDKRLHQERLSDQRRQRTHKVRLADLPDGVFIRHPSSATDIRLLWQDRLLKWNMEGYEDDGQRVSILQNDDIVEVLTPPVSVQALKGGYRPVLKDI